MNIHEQPSTSDTSLWLVEKVNIQIKQNKQTKSGVRSMMPYPVHFHEVLPCECVERFNLNLLLWVGQNGD